MYSAHTNEPLEVVFPDWGIYILESHHGSEFYMPATKHDYLKLIYVLEGEGHVSFKGSSLDLLREDLLVIPAKQEHQIDDKPKQPLALIVLCIQENVLTKLATLPTLRHAGVQKTVGDEPRKLLRRLFFEQSLQKPGCALMMTGLCLQLLALLSRSQASAGHLDGQHYDAKTLAGIRVKSYIEHLQTHFYVDEPLGDVADRLGISRRYFSLLFKDHTGESWLSYIRNLRVAYAKKLLISSDRSVTTITFECGFNDLSNFYRCFKKLEGTSPEKWRQAQRETISKVA